MSSKSGVRRSNMPLVLHLGAEKWCQESESASDMPSYECYTTLPWLRASESAGSESASDVPSCERYTARQTDIII
jgi:hypothetical protein